MVKKLRFLFSLVFMVLCAIPLVACGETPPPDDPGTGPSGGTLYNVWIPNPKDPSGQVDVGTASVSKTQAQAGETVTISYTLEPGYILRYFDIMKTWQDEWGVWMNERVDVVHTSFTMPAHDVSIYPCVDRDTSLSITEFEYDAPSDSYAVVKIQNTQVVSIPSSYNDGIHGEKPVTIIRAYATDYNSGNAIIRLPDTITTIEEFAICGHGIESINLPSSIVDLPETTLIRFGAQEIVNQTSTNYEHIGVHGTVVAETNFYKTSNGDAYFSFKEGKWTLELIKAAEHLVYPTKGITLTNIDNPSKTKVLGDYATNSRIFDISSDIVKTITLSEGVKEVYGLFYGPMLETVTLNNDLRVLNEGFIGTKVTTLTLPDSVEEWDGVAFNNKLTTVNISDNSKLKKIGEFYENSLNYTEYMGGKYLGSATNDYFILAEIIEENPTNFSIHPSCKVICGSWGMYENYSITQVNIPASVRSICEPFFTKTHALQSITIEEGSKLQYANFAIFNDMTSYKDWGVVFPASITKFEGVLGNYSFFQSPTVELDVQEDPYEHLVMFYDVDTVVDKDTYSYVLSHADEASLIYWDKNTSINKYDTIDGYPIVYIGRECFKGNSQVYGGPFSNKLRYIGKEAFNGCSSFQLSLFDYPNLQYVGEYAFNGCYGIDFVYIPAGCKLGASSLPTQVIAIEDSFEETGSGFWCKYADYATSISNVADYYNCVKGEEYIYGTSGEGKMVLIKYLGQASVMVPPATIGGKPVGSIAPYCYSGCNITSFDSLSLDITIEQSAFYNVTSLVSYKAKNGGGYTFSVPYDGYVETRPLNNLEYMEVHSFQYMPQNAASSLDTLIIHSSYSSLNGVRASSITIPYLREFLGESFVIKNGGHYSPPLEDDSIRNHYNKVPSTLKHLTILGGGSLSNYYVIKCSNIQTITLGDGVTSIGKETFSGCSSLTSVKMPGVATIDQYAFKDCTNLENVEFDYPLISIHSDAFYHCSNIQTATFCLANPNSTITANRFNLKRYVNIVNTPHLDMSKLSTTSWNIIDETTVTYSNMSKAKLAFKGAVPSGLKEAYLEQFEDGDEVVYQIEYPHLLEEVSGIVSNGTVEYLVYEGNKAGILRGLKDGYISLNITGLQITFIDDYAFQNSNITGISIPGTVKRIGKQAFENCSKLSVVNTASGLEIIGWSAFKDCTSLVSFTIPDSVTTMHNYAFRDCTSLNSVAMETTRLTTIPTSAFNGCKALTRFHLPSQVKHIESYAFYNTGIQTFTGIKESSLETIGEFAFVKEDPDKSPNMYSNVWISIPFTKLEFPETLVSVEKYAFTYCNQVTTITFGNNIQSIGKEAFYGNQVTNLTLPDSLTHIGDAAFAGNNYLVSYVGPTDEGGNLRFIEPKSRYSNLLKSIYVTSGPKLNSGCFSYFGELESVVIGDAFWDYFYAGEYLAAINYDVKYISVPCFMGSMEDFSATTSNNAFNGTLKVRGKAGFTGFPMSANSLYNVETINSKQYSVTYLCLDLSECLFTDVNVALGADVTYLLLPDTVTKISAEVITDGTIYISNPLELINATLEENVFLDYIVKEGVTFTDELWEDINNVYIYSYYVYNQAQYDFIKSKNEYKTVYMCYKDGMTKDENMLYWQPHKYGYPALA